jgi:hypothetical protein
MSYQNLLKKHLNNVETERKRAQGAGRKHTLSIMEKLFFILFYLKTYPTFDVLANNFGVNRSTACRWVHTFLPLLEETLKQESVLPEREINSIEEFSEKFQEIQEIYIDGTDRQTQRSSDTEKQKEHYSGKHKKHTPKNLVLSDSLRKILVLSETQPGQNHDYALFKELKPQIPPQILTFVDARFSRNRERFSKFGSHYTS